MKRPRCFRLAAWLALAVPLPLAAQGNTARRTMDLQVIEDANRAAVALVTMWAGTEKFDGTGFVVSRSGYLVTSRSAVSRQGFNADSVLVTLAGSRGAQHADVLNLGPVGVDLAVLRIRDYQGPFTRRVDWSGNRVRQGEPAAVIGFPGGASRGLDATGAARVSAYGGTFTLVNPERLQYDVLTSPGSGGSPVFNADGEVVGVHRARLSDGSVGIATPIRDLLRIMPPGLKAELGL
jgi:S1-C subfamily serine protease